MSNLAPSAGSRNVATPHIKPRLESFALRTWFASRVRPLTPTETKAKPCPRLTSKALAASFNVWADENDVPHVTPCQMGWWLSTINAPWQGRSNGQKHGAKRYALALVAGGAS